MIVSPYVITSNTCTFAVLSLKVIYKFFPPYILRSLAPFLAPLRGLAITNTSNYCDSPLVIISSKSLISSKAFWLLLWMMLLV